MKLKFFVTTRTVSTVNQMDFEVNVRHYKNDGDIDVLKEIASEEGWSTSDLDCKAILEVDRNGLFVAEDKSGSPVGFVADLNMSPGMSYIALFIVRKDLRGKGIGKKLWKAMMNAAKDNTISALDGVAKMKNWYNEHGFPYEAFCIKLCYGTLTTKEHFLKNKTPYSIELLSGNTWPKLVAYDRQIFGYTREDVLRAWLWATGSYSIVAVRNNSVVGYANLHWKSEKHCNIRMMYSDSQDVADALLENLLDKISLGTEVFFDMLAERSFPKCFSNFKCLTIAHRLYSKEIPEIQTDKIYFSATHML